MLTNCDVFDVFPPREFSGLVTVGRHVALIQPMLALLTIRAIRHSRHVYGWTFTHDPDSTLTRSWIDPGLRDKAIRRDLASLTSAMRPADLLDVSTRFADFPKPVRIVWGDADPFFPLDLAEKLVAVFPDATPTTVPGGRTFISMDFPEQVADVISAP